MAVDGDNHSQTKCRRKVIILLGMMVLLALVVIVSLMLPPKASTTASSTLDPTPPESNNSLCPLLLTVLDTSFEVLETVPHDIDAFTQGLELIIPEKQQYYESTGLYGQSSVRIVDLYSGEVLQTENLASFYFGEGLTLDTQKGRIVQITWKRKTGFVYNATNLELLQTFSYQTTNGEGWGICYESLRKVFFVSDGTNYLHTWNASSLGDLVTKVSVTMRMASSNKGEDFVVNVARLNELEWDSFSQTVLANVWGTDYVVRIHPETGFVTHRFDLQSLYRPFGAGVLNGIAQTDVENEIWVTGKLWPNMYRIRLL